MFSGIVAGCARVRKIDFSAHGIPFVIHFELGSGCSSHFLKGASLSDGESIACDGICLTITATDLCCFQVQVSEETVERTTVKFWKEGTLINIERALRLCDLVGGHLVSGHIDGVGRILKKEKREECCYVQIEIPHSLECYMIPKGSVALDGVSLTINNIDHNTVDFMLIPYTLHNTNSEEKGVGSF